VREKFCLRGRLREFMEGKVGWEVMILDWSLEILIRRFEEIDEKFDNI
jgi:hypothetical protein